MAEPLPGWLAPLLLPEELRASDVHAIETCGIPGIQLMERAGAALAEAALRHLPAGPIAVLCGPGNNGGDGLVAARLLHARGREVRVLCTRPVDAYRGDAALAAAALAGAVEIEPFGALSRILAHATGAIDALLGTGATGAPRGPEAEVIDALLASGLPVLACDLPSGVDSATGEQASCSVRAVATVTFHRASPGHLIHPGKAATGRLEVADIGIPAGAPIAPTVGAIRERVVAELPRRGAGTHKYSAGHVLVIAGSAQYPGAALLTVRGAQRAGAGYVTALADAASIPALHQAAPEAVVVDRAGHRDAGALRALLDRASAVVVGPGLSDPADGPLLDAVLLSELPVVVDAGGLALLGRDLSRLRRSAPLILTPHAGELARLLGTTSAAVQARRLASARELSAQSGAHVLLKGDDTLVIAPSGEVAVQDLASPALATAGTGDVLAGLLGAVLATGAPPWVAASAAARLHARAGRIAASRAGSVEGTVAMDVAEALPAARG